MTKTHRWLIAPLTVLALIAAACGDDGDDGDDTSAAESPTEEASTEETPPEDTSSEEPDAPTTTAAPTTTTEAPTPVPGVEGSITVFAATSLTDAFTELGEAFTTANPEADVEFFFEGSSTLAGQIIELAPADVFASADISNMTKVVDEELNADEPVIFATNLLTIIVAPGNPLGITGVEDLADPDLTLALCEPEQPCRNYSDQIFEAAGMETPESAQLANVGAVTNAVVNGEADAGIVYVTNVIAAGDDADQVEIPEEINVPAEYPITVLTESGAPEVAQAFIDFILSDDGQAILSSYGFGPAPGPGVEGSITVFAATSLTDAFTEIGEAFTAANPDAKAEFFFEGSSTLAGQIIELAPAEVFASADISNMTKVVDEELNADDPVIFATNLLTIIVAPGNPLGITGVEDLADPGITLALCEPEQPCRNYSDQIFEAAGMETPESAQLANVGAVTNAVVNGEADAGIVYVTNVIAAGDDADLVEIPEDINVPAEYPIAVLTESGAPEVAQAFIDFILGDEGQAILLSYGFGPPS